MNVPRLTNRLALRIARCLPALLLAGLLAACHSLQLEELASGTGQVVASPAAAALPQRYLLKAAPVHDGVLRVYFGGDGRPWAGGAPASDPTGRYQLGLRLFRADPRAGAYLGRPCYQLEPDERAPCDPRLWTSGRYGPVVVDAMAVALRELRGRSGAERVELVGYSGGATLALLVAAREAYVERVITVAPLLDPEAWTAHHGLLPLTGSLSPLEAPRQRGLEEWHLLGGQDTVVPQALARRYAARYPGARFRVIREFDHRCCWLEHWPSLLAPWPAP
jgi:pimeloyl-ACP methyl ester carboxylesterase